MKEIARPQAILFDLDDTLWPIAPVIAEAELTLHAWLAAHAPKVAHAFTIEELRARRLALLAEQPHYHLDLHQLRRAALEAAFAHVEEDARHLDGAMRHFTAARNAVQLYDDVMPGLMRLAEQVTLGVVTNGMADLEVIGIAHHFKVSLAASRFGKAKPDPAIFLAACDALDVAPQHAVYVGDDLRLDVEGAQKAGLRAVWMNRTGSTAHLEANIRPDAICTDFHELIAWLEQQLAD
ncbi:putative hydrolase of the HAD superfamily [Pseudoduganella flava]|uniref:HAD-IA family hydrolase n=1 Tax=Pseudoduganella flava TaxID=871742 RepID=A0A562PWT8_9BURK|nr:HAD family hydrolase [Pseudoduganella flava]QGZ39981.1 HAD-IA family hydrolase [Pseudoduganella flava]TWI48922.1 putative hydrolase of the HAD superfamily [Pseudoduganella flava]